MKKVSIVCLAGMMFFAACDNSGSSTVGTYEKDEETTQSADKKEEAPKEQQTKEKTESTITDTTKPSIEEGSVNTRGTTSSDSAQMNMPAKP